jgi:hypothetical protein
LCLLYWTSNTKPKREISIFISTSSVSDKGKLTIYGTQGEVFHYTKCINETNLPNSPSFVGEYRVASKYRDSVLKWMGVHCTCTMLRMSVTTRHILRILLKKFSLLIHTQNLISKNIRQILLVNKRAQVLSQSRYEISSSMNGPQK